MVLARAIVNLGLSILDTPPPRLSTAICRAACAASTHHLRRLQGTEFAEWLLNTTEGLASLNFHRLSTNNLRKHISQVGGVSLPVSVGRGAWHDVIDYRCVCD
eukprot:COSAG01_NODE_19146_length_1028_cov_0.769645_2_plen_103_part_00